MIRELFASLPHIVVAHRGFAIEHVENTLPAFEDALRAGADMLETDVQVSKDGVAVVSHDADLMRLVGRPEAISSLSVAQLGHIELGASHIPTLAELLATFPNEVFSIDVKSDAAVAPTVKAILDAGAQSRVMIASFSERRRRETTRQIPGVVSAGTTQHVLPAYLAGALGKPEWAGGALGGIDALFLPARAWGVALDTTQFANTLSRLGVVLGMWTINEPSHIATLWSRGVRAIVTDRTDLAVEARACL